MFGTLEFGTFVLDFVSVDNQILHINFDHCTLIFNHENSGGLGLMMSGTSYKNSGEGVDPPGTAI